MLSRQDMAKQLCWPFFMNLADFLGSMLDTITDLLQAWSLLGTTDTITVSVIYFVLKWLPAVFAYKCPQMDGKVPICILDQIIKILLHPLRLSWNLARTLWLPTNENQMKNQELQILRGCVESPILLIIQLWLIFYGSTPLTPLMNWSSLTFKDWEGNEFVLPYLRPVSIFTSFATVARSSCATLEKLSCQNALTFLIILNGIFYHIMAITVSITYLNNFGMVAPCIALFMNVLTRVFDGKTSILQSTIATFTPVLHNRRLEDLVKTFLYTANLILVLIVINVPFELLGFLYGENSLLDNFQANFLVGCLVCNGILAYLSQHLHIRSMKIAITLANFFCILTTLITICLHDPNSKFAYLSYELAPNHTVSIKGIISGSSTTNFEEKAFCGRLFTNPDVVPPEYINALKVKNFSDLEKLQHVWPALSLVVVKMTAPYLPAKSFKKLENLDFSILYISPQDWTKVPVDDPKVHLTSSLKDIQPRFSCSSQRDQSCVRGGSKSFNGFLKGIEARTRECFWLGKPCSNGLEKWNFKEEHGYCADSSIALCETTTDFVLDNHNSRSFRFSHGESKKVFDFILTLCDNYQSWTHWFHWTTDKTVHGIFTRLKRKRFCFLHGFSIEEFTYKYVRFKDSSDDHCQYQRPHV